MSAASLTPQIAARRPTARERLLSAADELFYAEGVHTVGIDRIIERAGVAKASLYSTFGSKEELVRAYLEGRYAARQERIRTGLEHFETPRDKLLGIFDILAASAASPGFRGCAFYNASAETTPGSVVEQVSNTMRAWTRALFEQLGREAGAKDPAALAAQMVVLYDGALFGARMDGHPAAVAVARSLAASLLDAAAQ